MAWHPIYNLELAGWNRQSTWGWDPALETLYAQLTRNESNIEADVHGPEIWIRSHAGQKIALPAVLAEAIAEATGAATAAVRAAMNDSLPDDDHPLRILAGGPCKSRYPRWRTWLMRWRSRARLR